MKLNEICVGRTYVGNSGNKRNVVGFETCDPFKDSIVIYDCEPYDSQIKECKLKTFADWAVEESAIDNIDEFLTPDDEDTMEIDNESEEDDWDYENTDGIDNGLFNEEDYDMCIKVSEIHYLGDNLFAFKIGNSKRVYDLTQLFLEQKFL